MVDLGDLHGEDWELYKRQIRVLQKEDGPGSHRLGDLLEYREMHRAI